MMKKLLVLSIAILVMVTGSFAHAISAYVVLENGAGSLDLMGLGSAEFSGFTINGSGNGLLEIECGECGLLDLPNGDIAYTPFVNLTIATENVNFGLVDITLTILPELAPWLSVGDDITVYSNQGEGWEAYAVVDVTELSGNLVLQTQVDHFSDWGGGGDDPTIPDPSVATIIGCGLLMFARKMGA